MNRKLIHVLYAWAEPDETETLCVSRVLATDQICVFRLPTGAATQARANKVYRIQDHKQPLNFFQQKFRDWCLTYWTSLQHVQVKVSKPLPDDVRPLTRKLGARVLRLDRASRYMRVAHQSTEYEVQLDEVPSFLKNNMQVNLECVLVVGGRWNNRLRCNGCNVQVVQQKRKRALRDTPARMRVVSPVLCLMQTFVQIYLDENGCFQVCSNAPKLLRFCNMKVYRRPFNRVVRAPPMDDLIQHVPMYKNKAKNAKFWKGAAPFLFRSPPKHGRRLPKQTGDRATSPPGLHFRSFREPKLRLLLCRATDGGNKFYARQFIQKYKKYMQQQQHNELLRSRNDNRIPPPPPTFVCPIVYAWMERNGGVADALSQLFKFDSLLAHINHLVRAAFLQWTSKQLMDYLETVMTSVLVPLFGDKGARRGIRNSFTRITLALTLSESGVDDDTVCDFVGQCIPIGDTYVQHIRRVLRGVDMKSIRRVAHLRIPKWVNVAYRKAPDGADEFGEGACLRPVEVSATARAVLWGGKQLRPHEDIIVKEELVNMQQCEQARRDLQQILQDERAKGKRADWTRIEQLKRYLKFLTTSLKSTERINDTTMGRRTVKYRKRGAIGRFIPSWPSFTMSPSNLRRFSCTEHTDVDIKNCHPTLLSQIIQRSPDHRHYDMLGQYVLHREKVLADLSQYYGGCSRGLVKDLVLRLINGGGINNWAYEIEDPVVKTQVEKVRAAKGEHEYVERLARELKHVRAMLVRLYYGAGADVTDVKLFSMCLQQLECVCIMAVTEFFERTLRMIVDTLVYDGIIVRSKNIRPEQLRACEAHVLDQTSFKIQLVTKPFPIVEF